MKLTTALQRAPSCQVPVVLWRAVMADEASEDDETGDCEGLGAKDERMRTQSVSIQILTIMLVVSAHKCK